MEIPIKVSNSKTLKNIRCIIATRDIKEGELIEVCPCIPIKGPEIDHILETVLNNYHFMWGDNYEDIALVLGYGMLYNHSLTPNVEFTSNVAEKNMYFNALCDIKEGEELFINYNQGDEGEPDACYFHYDEEIS